MKGESEVRYLSLFSGAGGGDLACQHLLGWRCVGYVEWEKDACETLDRRIKDGWFDDAQVWHCDIRDFNRGPAHVYSGMVDFVTGGPPCQPFSVAGRRAATGDKRNMVPAMLRTIGIVRPGRILLENSPTSTFRGYLLEFIIPRLRQMGYVGRYGVVSAEDAIWLNCYPGVPRLYHERKRTWVIAKNALATSQQCESGTKIKRALRSVSGNGAKPNHVSRSTAPLSAETSDAGRNQRASVRTDGRMGRIWKPQNAVPEVANAAGKRNRRISAGSRRSGEAASDLVRDGWWSLEPELGRVVHGLARRLDRCRAIGKGQVPAVVDIVEEMLNNGF